MLTRQLMHSYQNEMVAYMNAHVKSMIWAFLGSGKTLTTLTSIVDRMEHGQVKKTLIVAPLRVCYAVWGQEAKKWEHTKHLTFSIIHGTPEQRRQAFFKEADIYLVNYEGLVWLTDMLMKYYPDKLPYEMAVYDEVSCLKSSESVRMKKTSKKEAWNKKLDLPILDEKGKPTFIIKKGWRNICDKFDFTIGLTGTPSSNGYADLFGQYLVVDGGVRLFSFISHFRDAYFRNSKTGFGYEVTNIGKEHIERKISDITLSMNDASKYLDLPKVTVKDMFVELPKKYKEEYKRLEKDMYLALDSGTEVEVFNKAALSNKCLQYACGSVYTDLEGGHEHIHDTKFEALDEVMEEAAGSPVLVLYNFTISADVMMKRYKKYKPINLTKSPARETSNIVKKWNEGKTRMIVAHSACLVANTKVLTESRGWVKIINVKDNERVHDGIEFVKHDGLNYSGYKETIDVFDIGMTKPHKLLIDNNWIKAKNVDNSENIRRKARYIYKGNDEYLSEMFKVSTLAKKPETCKSKKQHVYDLVNCGKRSRFLIKNDVGEVFISHNSCGHGIDGLQDSGTIVCWFGVNWNLEYYLQTNGRIDRQGQTRPVSIVRILTRDTVDMAVAHAIDMKYETQEDLKNAIEDYRKGKAILEYNPVQKWFMT